jgi:hypothetical protein
MMGPLHDIDVRTIHEHLVNIFDEGELRREASIRKVRIVRLEGKRQVSRAVEHYNLDAILAVGFGVRSDRGTQFRQWAVGHLTEYLVKGFTMDAKALQNDDSVLGKKYFGDPSQRIREITSPRARGGGFRRPAWGSPCPSRPSSPGL